MGKILGLDIGDVWTGVAITDLSGQFVKPLETIKAEDLSLYLKKIINSENIETIVVGNPRTLRGSDSEQTKKVKLIYDDLCAEFKNTKIILWDERFSSKWAAKKGIPASKEEKLKIHARAAAFILDSYINFLNFQKQE